MEKNLFKTRFLSNFIFSPAQLPLVDQDIIRMDGELAKYEKLYLNPEVEKTLISQNEFLASFAISKAENSSLNLKEAEDVNKEILANPELNFIGQKLRDKKKLTIKDYEKLEFYNILKTFRLFNSAPLLLDDLTAFKIKEIHASLTNGLDVFKDYLPHFDVYRSGQWRDNDNIRVGEYQPATHLDIISGVEELLDYLKKEKTLISAGVFHAALYALHPFTNGNKRVCRILDHIILYNLGLNQKKLYSPSYYYHQEKARYYKYLLFSLEKKNFNYFSAFFQEALALSIINVLKVSLEVERVNFLKRKVTDHKLRKVFSPLAKRYEVQFKSISKQNKNEVSHQTLITYLKKGVVDKILVKREIGRNTYYRLNLELPAEELLTSWKKIVREKLDYVPDDILLA